MLDPTRVVNNSKTMPVTIHYKTFSLSKHTELSSSNSTCTNESKNSNTLKRINQTESISYGSPEKIQKVEKETKPWICSSSFTAGECNPMQHTIKPIVRDIMFGHQRLDKKDPISLAAVDFSISHFPPCTKGMEAIVRSILRKPRDSSYTHAFGTPDARRAIASHHSVPGLPLNPKHVIVTNGCSGALQLALASLLDPGTILLVPQPGFPLYEEIAESQRAIVVKYRLDPNRNWECDMDHLEEIMRTKKHNVRAMVVNNPSSHGAVFTEEHLSRILDFALDHRLPIVSDEVYGNLTFGSHKFHPLSNIAARHGQKVPVITTSSLSKQFLVPGWRIGWLVFHDNIWGSLKNVQAAAEKLARLQHGVSHLQQSAISTLLSPSTSGLASWRENLRKMLEDQARFLSSKLGACRGLKVLCPPQGSMYTILGLDLDRFDGIRNDVDFCHKLVREENVFVLPGSSFEVPGTIRVAFSADKITLATAIQRISSFCDRHDNQPTIAKACGKILSTTDEN